MDILNIIYGTITLLIIFLILVTIWSRRPYIWRVSVFFVGLVLVLTVYVALLELMSRPKPNNLEIAHKQTKEVTLLHVSWIEEEAIYILIQIPDVNEPRLYKLPWSKNEAQNYENAMAEGEEQDIEVKIGNPFFESDEEDRERLVYTSPVRPMPQKGREQVDTTVFDPEEELETYGVEEKN